MIRQEIKSQEKLDYATISSLPILDSFIKESVRLNPLDLSKQRLHPATRMNLTLTVSIRRKALKPFQFANNGPRVEVGQIACVSAYDVMHNETKYPNPQVFDGLRFVKDSSTAMEGEAMRGTTLTEGTKDFPIWGFGSKIWSVLGNLFSHAE